MGSKTHPQGLTPVAAKHDLAATATERREMGRQARVLAPRAEIGDWDEKARGHDPVDTLLAQNAIRLPELHGSGTSAWGSRRGTSTGAPPP